LKEAMVYSLRALSQSSEFILSTTEAFVKEPMANWCRHELKSESEGTGSGISTERQQVEMVQAKLNGKNPIHILEQLLQTQKPLYIPHWTKVLKENRGELGSKTTVSVEESVDLLIILATDPNILGRTYFGWSSWV